LIVTAVVGIGGTLVEINASSVVRVHLPATDTVANVGAHSIFTFGVGRAVVAHVISGFINIDTVSSTNVGGI